MFEAASAGMKCDRAPPSNRAFTDRHGHDGFRRTAEARKRCPTADDDGRYLRRLLHPHRLSHGRCSCRSRCLYGCGDSRVQGYRHRPAGSGARGHARKFQPLPTSLGAAQAGHERRSPPRPQSSEVFGARAGKGHRRRCFDGLSARRSGDLDASREPPAHRHRLRPARLRHGQAAYHSQHRCRPKGGGHAIRVSNHRPLQIPRSAASRGCSGRRATRSSSGGSATSCSARASR